MSEKVTLKIEKRQKEGEGTNKQLRRAGYIPAVINSKGKDSLSIKIKRDELVKSISKHGKNYLFTLDMGDKNTYAAIIKDMQYSPVKRDLLHVDFQHVSLDTAIKMNLAIKILGRETIEHKRLLIIQQLDEIPVKGLPQDIPESVEIDVAAFEVGDRVHVEDLKLPAGIVAEIEGDALVLTIREPKISEDVEEEAAEETEAATEEEAAPQSEE